MQLKSPLPHTASHIRIVGDIGGNVAITIIDITAIIQADRRGKTSARNWCNAISCDVYFTPPSHNYMVL